MECVLGVFVLLSFLVGFGQCEWCSTGGYTWGNDKYCAYGCCGDYPNEYCCGPYVWIIVVSVVGGVIFLSCVVAVVCCVVKQQGQRGRVIQPATGVATVTYTTAPGGQPPYNNYGVQPAQYNAPPPPYGHPVPASAPYGHPGPSGQDPAYPPVSGKRM